MYSTSDSLMPAATHSTTAVLPLDVGRKEKVKDVREGCGARAQIRRHPDRRSRAGRDAVMAVGMEHSFLKPTRRQEGRGSHIRQRRGMAQLCWVLWGSWEVH